MVPNKEPLIPIPLPEYPRLGSDLFTLKGVTYLLVVVWLKSLTAQSVIAAIMSTISHHGIPEVLLTDNGPQYDSQEFAKFASQYGFSHTTTSPYFPQSKGHAERNVTTVKKCFKKSDDPYLALLSYCATPLP